MRPFFFRRRAAREEMLTLVPFFCGERERLIGPLAQELASAFRVRVVRQVPEFDPEEAYDAGRGQYETRKILSHLLEQHDGDGKILGVTEVDLFVPILTFVFGEAQMGGCAAVVSSHRLAPERYGLAPNAFVLEQRLFKEAIHELGHAYGLIHCSDRRCVMASSPAVEGIDLKSSRFCGSCRRVLDGVEENGRVKREG